MFCLHVVCCHVIGDLLSNSPNVRKAECGKATGLVNVPTAICWSLPTDREAVTTLSKVLESLHLDWPRFPCISSVAHLSRAELWGAIQALSGVDEKTNIQFLIDAKYVTKGDTQRGELEYGPSGDLWSIVFRLIDERSGTDVIKVMSHLKDVGSSVILHDEMAFHPMLANSLADVLAEEAAKWLLPDMNSEQKAKELNARESVCPRGWLWCKLTPYVPRPSSKDVIASFRARKRLHSIAFNSHLADDSSVFRGHNSASDFSTPVPTEKQIISENNHGMDTPTVSVCTRPHGPADWTNFLVLDMYNADGVVGESLCGLDPSCVRLQPNLDDLDDGYDAFTHQVPLSHTGDAMWSSKKKTTEQRDTKTRQAKSLKFADRVAKRKLIALPEISFVFDEQLLRNREPRTVKHFVDVIHASHMLAPLQEHSTVFFCSHCDAVIFVGSLRLLKSQCDGSAGSRGKARRLFSGCLRDRRRETLKRTLNSAEADALNASSTNEEQPCMRRTLRGTERDADGVGIW